MEKSMLNIKTIIFLFGTIFLFNSCMYKSVGGLQHIKKPEKANSIAIKYDYKTIYSYGETIPFGIEMIAKRKVKKTPGYLRGKLSWENFNVEVEGGSFHEGVVYIEEGNKSDVKEVILYVELKGNTTLNTRKTIPLRNIEEIEIEYDKSNALLGPRGKIELGITNVFDNNEITQTEGFLRGDKEWSLYSVEVEGGTYREGEIIIGFPENHKVKVIASLLSNPTLKTELTIPLDYKGKYSAYYDGKSGRHGRRGNNGFWGQKGRKFSSVGGDGGQGRNGGHGENGRVGENGMDGEAVDVYVSAEENKELGITIVSVLSIGKYSGRKSVAKFTPEGGSYLIYARGGHGGHGGDGGIGGRGGDGGRGDDVKKVTHKDGTTTETCGVGGNGGFSGHGGDGGDGGIGGKGGTITFHIDESASAYQYLIRYDVSGGRGGDAGMAGYSENPGQGGKGGCSNGRDGRRGRTGMRGFRAPDGYKGPTPIYIKEPVKIDWEKMAQT